VHVAIALVVLAAAVIAVTAVCGRLKLPAPLVLVTVGIIASFVPLVPEVQLTSEIVLVGLLPPLLYSAALQTSLVDFNANRRAILLLSIGLVVFTTVGIALVVHLMIPGINWPAAFAIGAVVAPPDAVAATSIGRRIGLPRRAVTVLEGESLLNDATALVALRTAIAAGATAGSVSVAGVTLDFLVAAGGGLVVGLLTFLVIGWVRRRLTNPVMDTSISFVAPFAAYVAAESVEASGVLAVVVAGLLLGHKSPVLQNASSRIAERLNWRTISFLLEHTVFLLIGLQARRIVADVAGSDLSPQLIIGICAVSLVAVIVLRLVWVLPARFLLVIPEEERVDGRRPSWSMTAIVGWAGMRGVVTLAAAFAIPRSFPHRDVLVLIALTVAAGTLFLQGLTLPWVARLLRLRSPDAREDALARAVLFQKASAAGLDELEAHAEEEDPHNTMAALRQRAEQRDFAAWERLGNDDPEGETPSEAYARMRLEMLKAERAKVLEVRSTGLVPHAVVEDVLGALDVEESMLDVRARRHDGVREAQAVERSTAGMRRPCEHLEAARDDTTPNVDGACEDCLREGTTWVHLRLCLDCGHMGCCDSSIGRHATKHFRDTDHPVMRSGEPGEDWRWCFVDDRLG
jgi:CPA1 family monovalent cation:H+ antiporter